MSLTIKLNYYTLDTKMSSPNYQLILIRTKKYQLNNTESSPSTIIHKENRTQKARHRWLLDLESLSIARTETNLQKN